MDVPLPVKGPFFLLLFLWTSKEKVEENKLEIIITLRRSDAAKIFQDAPIFLQSRDRIVAAFAEGIATQNSPQRHQSSARPAVSFDRF